MPIYDATYTISNAEFSNFISLPNEGNGPVSASSDSFNDSLSLPGSQWDITPLSGGNRYYIQNHGRQSLYAWCKPSPLKGDNVTGNSLTARKTEWIIKETDNLRGHYTISPADNDGLFWGLEDGNINTPVELKEQYGSTKNRWVFHPHSTPPIVKTVVDALTLSLDWLDTTNPQEPFQARVTGTLQSRDLPADSNATISFPKRLRVVWETKIVAYSEISATYGASQVDKRADNARVFLNPEDDGGKIIADFVRTALKKESIPVELQADEVTVHARGKDYPGIAVNFRKSITLRGFDYLKDQIIVEKIKITGTDSEGKSLTALTDITIKNPSNLSVLLDELPVAVYYTGTKIANFTLPSFKLHHRSEEIEYRALEVPVKFQPAEPHDDRCKEFIAKFITTAENINISLSLERTVVKLGPTPVSIPAFTLKSTVAGIDKKFVTDCTVYISILRASLTRRIKFGFTFENPIDTSLTVGLIKGKAIRKSIDVCKFEKDLDMSAKGNATVPSPSISNVKLLLSFRKMLTFLGKTKLTEVSVDVERATVSIGKFSLPDLKFKLKDVKTKLKWAL